MSNPETKLKSSRRQFLKATGLTGAFLGSGGLGIFGYAAGKDFDSYTG
ncbi:MAG: twin-arginine translocation signal domain-containing protein, partial [Planctomycetes bacterium]|nr:twin-arginine translocation signal domain-containing protein [Planctomycetota bacterium]